MTRNNQPTEDRYDPVHDDGRRRSSAIVAFLGTGMDPKPTRANMVDRLAHATRTVRELSGQGRQLEDWLADEMRIRGIRENAAVLAVLEIFEPGSDLVVVFRGHARLGGGGNCTFRGYPANCFISSFTPRWSCGSLPAT